MNSISFKLSRILPLILCFVCLNLFTTDMYAQGKTRGSNGGTMEDNTGGTEADNDDNDSDPEEANDGEDLATPLAFDPPSGDDYDYLICADVWESGVILPIYLKSYNNVDMTISNITLDVPSYVSYTTPTETVIPANSEIVVYVTFQGGVTLSEIYGVSAPGSFYENVSFTLTYMQDSGLFSSDVTILTYYCVNQLNVAHPDNNSGAQTDMGKNKRLSQSGEASKGLGISPNPTKGNIIVDFEVSEDEKLVDLGVYNSLGQKVKSLVTSTSYMEGIYREEYTMNELDKGVYYLIMQIGDDLTTETVVKL